MKKKKCSLFPFLMVFSTWKRKDGRYVPVSVPGEFLKCKGVIEICVSWDLSVEPLNVSL